MSHRVGDRRFSPYWIPRSKISITSESYTILSLFFLQKGIHKASRRTARGRIFIFICKLISFRLRPTALLGDCDPPTLRLHCRDGNGNNGGRNPSKICKLFFSFSSSFIYERKDMWDAVPLVLSQSRHVVVTGAGVGYIRNDVK